LKVCRFENYVWNGKESCFCFRYTMCSVNFVKKTKPAGSPKWSYDLVMTVSGEIIYICSY
jgi:hypothetical protein